MRQRSETWANLAIRGRFYLDVRAVIGNESYTAISAPVIEQVLCPDGLSVGNCSAASMRVSILTDDTIPKAAEVVIQARLTDGSVTSEWQDFGTYYIDKRETDNGLTTIHCYDAMLKASQYYTDVTQTDPDTDWPMAMEDVVDDIADLIGVSVDARTEINTGAAYQMSYPLGYTMMEVLGFIGACHGGNWIITPDNELRLVPIVPLPDETFDVIDYEYHKIYTPDGYKLVYQHVETGEPVINTAGGGLINVPIVIGKITTGHTVTISRITMTNGDLVYTHGDDTGYNLTIEGNPYASQVICDSLYTALAGVEYAPFEITKSCFDPCTELGDWILVGDQVRSVLYKQRITLDIDFRADASAPGKDEAGSEYPYLSKRGKLEKDLEQLAAYVEETNTETNSNITEINSSITNLNSRITQTRSEILLEVAGTYATQSSVSSSISALAGSITLSVSNSTSSSTITLSGNGITTQSQTIQFTGNIIFASNLTDGITTISGANITTGKIQSSNGRVYFDLDNNELACSMLKTASAWNPSAAFDPGDVVIDTSKVEQSGAYFSGVRIYKEGNAGNAFRIVPPSTLSSYNPGSPNDRVLLYSTGGKKVYLECANTFSGGGVYSRLLLSQNEAQLQALSANTASYYPAITISGTQDNISLNAPLIATFLDASQITVGVLTATALSVSGTKNRIVHSDAFGDIALYSYETASPMFGDIGWGELDGGGYCAIALDPILSEALATGIEYYVFLQKEDDGDLWVSAKHPDYFEVHGTPGCRFSWELKAKQKDYEYLRLKNDEDIGIQDIDYSDFDPEEIDYAGEGADLLPMIA